MVHDGEFVSIVGPSGAQIHTPVVDIRLAYPDHRPDISAWGTGHRAIQKSWLHAAERPPFEWRTILQNVLLG
jgi:ABC-type nitrate/sulfonate/bicarbonate transport system ATPase subunit